MVFSMTMQRLSRFAPSKAPTSQQWETVVALMKGVGEEDKAVVLEYLKENAQ